MSRPMLRVPDDLGEVDLTDRILHSTYDLTDFWRHLRAEQPVYRHPGTSTRSGFWVLSTHRDVSAVYRDHHRFTSERGNVLDALCAGGDSASGRMLSLTDGARHRDIRRILTHTFSLRGLDALGRRIRAAARQLVEQAVEKDECDFAVDVAKEIPLQAICDLLGIPHGDRQRIFALTSSMVASEQPEQPVAEAWQAKNEVLFYFSALAEERWAHPGDDIVTLLVEAAKGSDLTEDEIIFNCYSLILGGGETTRMAISGGVLALIENPDQWAAFVAGDVPVSSAVEEILRWTSPSMHLARTALEDVEFGGTVVRAGDITTLWNVSANRDETAFDRPDRFDITRSPNQHTALGMGSHFCLGSHLARLEITAVLECLRELVGGMRLVGTPRRIYSNFLGGLCGLPVALTPAQRGRRTAMIAAPSAVSAAG